VSVIIPAYNRAELLRRALASVWSQHPALPDEVIVVDDGSEDQTSAVATQLGATVIRHSQNRGLSAARNSGLGTARHAWVALLDSDDEWLPHHLSTVWALRGDHVLVSGSALRCGEDPARDRFAGPLTRAPLVLRSADQLVYPGNIVPVSASLFRRQLALDVGGFRAHHGVVEDFDMWLRLLERGTAVCSPLVTIIYHLHAGQMSAQDARTMQRGHAAAAAAHMHRAGSSSTPLRRFQVVAAWDNLREALQAGERRAACRWGAYIAARPQRVLSLGRALAGRYRLRQRSEALRQAGIRRQG
jgi:GT2 family glycosyltransferase